MSARYKFAPNIIVASGTNDKESWEINRTINHAAYERDTLATLDAIWQGSWTGTSVIQGIAEKPGINVVITPYSLRECNAESNPMPDWATRREINVRFLPSTWQAGQPCAIGAATTPDAALLHELVHAYRQINGHVIKVSCQVPGFRYENVEEFCAITLTNIHVSAKGERSLRKDHKDYSPMSPLLAASQPFMTIKEHVQLVHNLLCDHYWLCQHHVRKDQCAFNPVDYFLKNSGQIVEIMKRKPDPPSAADIETRKLQEEDLERKILEGPGKPQPAHR